MNEGRLARTRLDQGVVILLRPPGVSVRLKHTEIFLLGVKESFVQVLTCLLQVNPLYEP